MRFPIVFLLFMAATCGCTKDQSVPIPPDSFGDGLIPLDDEVYTHFNRRIGDVLVYDMRHEYNCLQTGFSVSTRRESLVVVSNNYVRDSGIVIRFARYVNSASGPYILDYIGYRLYGNSVCAEDFPYLQSFEEYNSFVPSRDSMEFLFGEERDTYINGSRSGDSWREWRYAEGIGLADYLDYFNDGQCTSTVRYELKEFNPN